MKRALLLLAAISIVLMSVPISCKAQNVKNTVSTVKDGHVIISQPLTFINPTGRFIRKGQSTIVEWQGGDISNEKELELYKGTERIASFGKIKNVWLYRWTVSKDLKKGNDYTFRLTGNGEKIVSSPFSIKPRVPLLVKLSPLIIAAAIIPFLSGENGTAKNNLILPGAPDPE